MLAGACALVVWQHGPAWADAAPITSKRLANGLTILIQEDHRLPSVGIAVAYAIGMRDEPPALAGLCHVIEHALLGPSLHVPEGTGVRIERIGGVPNGRTTADATETFEELPSRYWELGLWIESDRMAYLLSVLDAAELQRIRETVKRESERRANEYHDRLSEMSLEPIFPPGHPYANLGGRSEAVDDITLDYARTFFQQHFGPAEAVLAIVGDIDTERASDAVNKYFASITSSMTFEPRAMLSAASVKLEADEERVLAPGLYRNWRYERLDMMWPTPAWFEPGDAELDVLASVLQARLFKRFVLPASAFSVTVRQESLALGSVFTIQFDIIPGHALDEIQSELIQELQDLSRPSAAIARARSRWRIRQIGQLDNMWERASRLARTAAGLGHASSIESDVRRYELLRDEDIRRAADHFIAHAPHVIVRSEFNKFMRQPRPVN